MMRIHNRTNTNDSRLRNLGLRRVLAALIASTVLLSASLSYVVLAASTTPSFSFNAVGDIGATSWGTDPQLRAIPSDGTSFSIFLGDMSYSSITPESAWAQWVKDRVGTNYPIELISGNHEDNGPDGLIDNFAAALPHRLDTSITGIYGKEYYFDYPSTSPLARFILISPGLDFTNGGSYRYSIGNAHYTWVANAIDDARAKNIPWVIVGYHKTCITTGAKSCYENTDLLPIYQLLLTKKVDLILHGHDHNYQRAKQLSCVTADSFTSSCLVGDGSSGSYTKGLGSVSVIVGTGGEGNYQVNANDAEAGYFAKINGDTNTIGHLVVTVSPNRLDAQYRSVLNTFTDSFSITATASALPPASTTTLSTFDSGLTQGVAKSASGTSSSSTTWEVPVPYSADQSKTLWQISPNPWAVTSPTNGSVSVQYTAKGSVVIRNTLQGNKGSFGGYPEIIYGRSPWGATAVGQPPTFPIQLSGMSELTADASYNLAVTQIAGNIAYDLFLTSVANTNDNTGAIEVMVWLWKKDIVTGGNLVGSITVPITMNGSPFQAKFNVWTGAAGGNAATVWFLLDDTQMIQSGNIKLSLLFFAKDALQRLGKSLDLYLQGVEFGTEFTQANQDYTFTITKFNVEQTLGSSTTPTLPIVTLTASPTSVPADGTSKSTITAQLSDNKASVAVSFATTLGTLVQCVTGTGGSCTTTITSPTAGTATITGSASGYTSGSTSVTFTTSTLPASILTTLDSGLTQGIAASGSGTSSSSTTWSVPVRDSTDLSKTLWDLSPNPWAVTASTSGSVSIDYTAQGSVIVKNTLTGITGPFGGYPRVLYGRNPWGDLAVGQPPTFPIKIKDMSELTSEVSYSLSFNKMTGNIMYDLWLTNTPNTTDNAGATEIMIRFWQNMGTPDGLQGSINVPATINGASSQLKFNVYVGTTFSTPGGAVVTYLPDSAQRIQTGSVKVSLLAFVTDTIQRVGRTSDSYLQGVEFGTEFTQADQDYTFTMTKLDIQQTMASTTATPPIVTLTASPTSVPADGTSKSTITAQLSDNKASVTVNFATTLGTLSSAQCVTGVSGSCTTTIASSTAGTATITGSASGYTSGGMSVTFTTPPCTRTNPNITLSPSSQTGLAGSTLSYTVSVKNNDANCGTESFTPSVSSCPSLWTCTLASTSLSIASGSTGSTTLTVTSLLTAVGGTYTASVKATGPSGLAGEGSASVILSALPQPSLSYTLKFEGYDLDNPNEVTVLLNGKVVATLPATASPANDNTWLLVSLDITSYVVSGENTLTFQEKQGGAILAVRNVSIVDSNGATIFADNTTRTVMHSPGSGKPSTTYAFTV